MHHLICILTTLCLVLCCGYMLGRKRWICLPLILLLLPGQLSAQALTPTEKQWAMTLHDTPKGVHTFSQVMSYSSYVVAFATPLAQMTYSLVKKDDLQFKHFLTTGFGLASTVGLGLALKYTIRRERPYKAYPDDIPPPDGDLSTSYSFPSTHTAMAFQTATTLTLQYRKWYISVPFYLWASTVAYSRLNLGAHYATDVAFGAVLGAGCAVATYYINQAIWKRINQRKLIRPNPRPLPRRKES